MHSPKLNTEDIITGVLQIAKMHLTSQEQE